VTREDVEAELEQVPFIPFRLHLVSGKTLDVMNGGEGWMLQRSILVTRARQKREASYDVVSLIMIERIERLERR
jgi:hypothetical protein